MVRAAVARGWAAPERTGGGHFKMVHPSGKCVWFGNSPSDYRATLNLRSDIRRIERGD
jgi:hypothetical protein